MEGLLPERLRQYNYNGISVDLFLQYYLPISYQYVNTAPTILFSKQLFYTEICMQSIRQYGSNKDKSMYIFVRKLSEG